MSPSLLTLALNSQTSSYPTPSFFI